MEIKSTVTISLEVYEEMKHKISYLQKQNQEKTIYKHTLHPIYGYVMLSLIFGYMFYKTFNP